MYNAHLPIALEYEMYTVEVSGKGTKSGHCI